MQPRSGRRGAGRTARGFWRTALAALAGGLIAALVMLLANSFLGEDRGRALADCLGLESGVLLAAFLGVAVGGWLALVGIEGTVRAYAILAGLIAAWALYTLGRPHVWFLTAVLTGAFGPAAAPYTSLLAFLLLAGAFRLAAPLGRIVVESLLRLRQTGGKKTLPLSGGP